MGLLFLAFGRFGFGINAGAVFAFGAALLAFQRPVFVRAGFPNGFFGADAAGTAASAHRTASKARGVVQERLPVQAKVQLQMLHAKGMRIDGVKDDRPAFNAKLKKGDIVVKMGDLEIVDMMSYMKALGAYEKGQTIDITIIRDGKEDTRKLTF